MDWFLGVIGFEEEKLGYNGCGHGFVDFSIETDDSFLGFNQTNIPRRQNAVSDPTFNSLEKISSGNNRLTRLLFHHHHHHHCEHTGVPATPLSIKSAKQNP